MGTSGFIRDVLKRFPADKQTEIIDEAEILTLRRLSGVLTGTLTSDETRAILTPLLRHISLTDDEFKVLAHDADLEISPDAGPTEISVDVPLVHFDESGGMPLNELTAASIVLWHVSHRIAHVIDALGVPVALAPPAVAKVYPGSIGYSLAGSSLLIGGIGLIILAYTALPLGAAATIAFWGGGISAISGIVESALGWYKTYKETSKIDSEIRLNDANTRKTELEILKMQSEFHPASALVPAAVISAEARQLGFDSAIATHLVNQVLPQYATLSSNYPSPVRVTSIGGRASASAAGA